MTVTLSKAVKANIATMEDRIRESAVQDMIIRSLGKMMDPVYFGTAVSMTLRETPGLANCDPATFLGAIIECALLALIPGSTMKQVHIIPYKQKATVVLGFRGLNILAYRAGCKMVYADCVHKSDRFEYSQGTGEHSYIIHRPADDRDDDDPGSVTHAWAKIITPQGGEIFKVMSIGKLDAIKDQSPAGKKPDAPWNTHTNLMRQKSPLRFAVDKFAPADAALSRAAILDDLGEQGMNQNLEDRVIDLMPKQVQVAEDPPPATNGHAGKERVKEGLRKNGNGKPKSTPAAQPADDGPPIESYETAPEANGKTNGKKNGHGPSNPPATVNEKPSFIAGVPEKFRAEMGFDGALKWYMQEQGFDVADLVKWTGLESAQIQLYLSGDSLPVEKTIILLGTALRLHKEDRDFLVRAGYIAGEGDCPESENLPPDPDAQGSLV